MSFNDAAEVPIVIGSLTFPKLTIRTTAALAAKKKAADLANLRALADAEKMLPENKARFLAITATADYGRGDVRDWVLSFEGAVAACVAALVQGGMKEAETAAAIDGLDPDKVVEAAMEVVRHPNAPSRQPAETPPANPPPAAS